MRLLRQLHSGYAAGCLLFSAATMNQNSRSSHVPLDSVDALYGIVREPNNLDSLPAPLNFPDGNIILSNGTISMRLHVGVLSLHSHAFTRLFESHGKLRLSENPATLTLEVEDTDFVAYVDAIYNRAE